MYEFINPYNFVPFGDTPKTEDKEKQYRGEIQRKLLSGWLDIQLIVKTPMIIPDGAHPRYYDIKSDKYVDNMNQSNEKNIHKEYSFMKLYNPEKDKTELAITSSELRGMIRSAYEAVTNSCVPFLLNDKPMSQRVPLYGALNHRGLLGYDGKRWILYSAAKELEEVIVVPLYEAAGKYYIESLDIIKNNKENDKLKYQIMSCWEGIEKGLNGYKWENKPVICNAVFTKNINNKRKWDIKISDQVKVSCVDKKIVRYLFVKANGEILEKKTGIYVENRGWLQYNVPVDTSRVYHIAYLSKREEVYRWSDSSAKGDENREAEAYKKLKSALYRDGASGKNTNNECNQALRQALECACIDKNQLVPVYYFTVKDGDREIVYMSGSAAGRIAQRRKWEEIMQGHTPCDKKLCPACLLFGTIKDRGMKGHVRFTDAFLTKPEQTETSTHTLQVLAAPRTTAFEFYLTKPVENATYWNYDFYGVTEGDNNEENHTNYYHLEKALPRGRKMYWHHKITADDSKKTNLNNTMESLSKGTFYFKLYFDQISKEQLQDLIWTITLGENTENSMLWHKIGHAKPLGYGSVKLIVNGGKVREFKMNSDINNFTFTLKDLKEFVDIDNIEPTFDHTTELVRCFLKMCDANAVRDERVDYPRKVENGQIYQWFSTNRTNSKRLEVLPTPLDKELCLSRGKKPKESISILNLKRISPDKNDFSKYVGSIDDGIVFNIPSMSRNLKIKAVLISEKNGRKYYNFVDWA